MSSRQWLNLESIDFINCLEVGELDDSSILIFIFFAEYSMANHFLLVYIELCNEVIILCRKISSNFCEVLNARACTE
jgi:hypothetical protein